MDSYVIVLTQIEEITDHVLSYLPVVDLLSKRRVCTAWRNSIDRIVSKRLRSTYITYNMIETNSETASQCEISGGEFFSTFRNKYGRRVKRVKYESNNFAPEHRQMVDTFLKWRATWTHIPKIIFVIHRLNKVQDKECMQNFKQLNEVIVRYLPLSCTLVMLRGVICCPGSEDITWLQNEALLFSSVMKSTVNVLAWQSVSTHKDRSSLVNALTQFLAKQRDVKAFIFFYRLTSQHIIARWIRSAICPLLESTVLCNNNAVVLGCAVEGGIQHSQLCNNMFIRLADSAISGGKSQGSSSRNGQKSGAFFAMAITGKSVFSSSVVLGHHINSVKELTDRVQLLKSSVPSHITLDHCHNNSFAMMVSCIGRMHEFEWYTDYDPEELNSTIGSIERATFEKIFPTVPLMVTHGFGEVGGDFNIGQPPSARSGRASLMHYHSTIFALVIF